MFETLTSLLAGVTIAFTSIFNPAPLTLPEPIVQESPELGAFAPAAGGTYRLKSSIGTTDTTINLSSFKEPVSNVPITMASIASDIGYGTLDPQSSTRKEFISFTGVTQNSDGSAQLTGVTRGLAFTSPFTASSTLRKSHPGQSIFILSDSPQFFNEYARRRSDETITGQWTFDVFPLTPDNSTSTETAAGVVELATGAEAAASTLEGTASRLALSTAISTSTAPSSGNVVPVTGSDGNLAEGFLPSERTATTTFATSSLQIGDTGSIFNVGKNIETLTTAGTSTYSVPDGVEKIIVQVIGAGGNGGDCSNGGSGSQSGGAGGGGGGYALETIDVSATTSITYHVGDNNVNRDTIFGPASSPLLKATGGNDGVVGGGTGGIGSLGDLNIKGEGGESVSQNSSSVSGEKVSSGSGGSSHYGGGGGGGFSGGNGFAGGNYGGGGGGGHCSGNNDGSLGAIGADGVIIITY